MKRRHFLQFATAILTSGGLNSVPLQRQADRYGQALAQPTRRKRALLVGVNDYAGKLRTLKGCVTDVELQKALLTHRFGFVESDILILKDTDATRDNILTAFKDHLINACEEGDVAVFHFSGHGRRVSDRNPARVGTERDPLNSTLVPYPDSENSEDIPDIMGWTLFLLTSLMKTDNITTVLDSCYAEGGIRGNVRIRSGGRRRDLQPSQAELDYQASLITELTDRGVDSQMLQAQRDISIAKGIALAAARRNQEAADATFGTTDSGESFNAGAFTYFLTQYLWHETDPVFQTLANVSRNLADDTFSQTPAACVAPLECGATEQRSSPLPTYFVDPVETRELPPAEGVVLSVADKRGTVWLGGSDHYSLDTYGPGATFTAFAADGNPIQEGIVVRSRRGLRAEVTLPDNLPPGTFLQESSRVIPPNYKLRVGIDPSLMAEVSTLQTAFGTIRRLELVPFESEATPYPGEIHYILSRLTPDYLKLFADRDWVNLPAENPPPEDSLVLFSPGLDEVIPGSSGEAGESVEEASDRLFTKFNALVAARLVKLLVNANSSQLAIQAEMAVVGVRAQQAQYFTVRESRERRIATPGSLLEVPVGRSLQFTITHQEPDPIHLIVFVVDREGTIFPVFPRQFLGIRPEDTLIAPNQPKLVPDPAKDPPLNVTSAGFGEVLIIGSRAPLTQAIRALSRSRTATTPVVDALMGDLSGVQVDVRSGGDRELRIQATQMAAMTIPFRVMANPEIS